MKTPTRHTEVTDLDRLEFTLESTLVRRFHATPSVTEKQMIGQHCAGMLHIAAFLLSDFRNMSIALVQAIMTHDQHELMTGDIPFTFKRDFPQIKPLLDAAEAAYDEAFLSRTPDLQVPCDEHVLKLADQLEGLWWTILHEPSGRVHSVWTESIKNILHTHAQLGSLPDAVLQRARQLLERFTHPATKNS